MAGRSWTVVVVPHGSDASRTIDVSERTLRRVAWGVGGGLLICAIALTAAALRFSGSPLFAAFMTPADRQLVDLRTRMAELRDTISVIDKRDVQIRLLAGLPSQDSVAASTMELPLDVDTLIARAHTLSASFATVSTTLSRNSERMSATPSIMPTTGWLSSEFSRARFHPILHLARPHEGLREPERGQ